MNTQYHELVKEAGFKAFKDKASPGGFSLVAADHKISGLATECTRRLYEAVVRECIWQVVKDDAVPHDIQVLIGERLKEHFGIE